MMETVEATNGRTGPSMNKGKSRQTYGTPPEFIEAVRIRFGNLAHDLAASGENTVCRHHFYDEQQNSLIQPWHRLDVGSGWLWLNPPFADIESWAKKCAEEANHGARILLLTPASIGTDWFANHVHGKALVFGISPRLTFVGCDDPYPKDLMLSVYCYGAHGFDVWRWRK